MASMRFAASLIVVLTALLAISCQEAPIVSTPSMGPKCSSWYKHAQTCSQCSNRHKAMCRRGLGLYLACSRETDGEVPWPVNEFRELCDKYHAAGVFWRDSPGVAKAYVQVGGGHVWVSSGEKTTRRVTAGVPGGDVEDAMLECEYLLCDEMRPGVRAK